MEKLGQELTLGDNYQFTTKTYQFGNNTMEKEIIYDQWGRPCLELDRDSQIVTALRDCCVDFNQNGVTESGTSYCVEFVQEKILQKDSE